MRESVHEKKEPAAYVEILEALKGDAPPRSGSHPGRSGVPDVELLQKVALKKEDACEPGFQIGTASGQIRCYIVTKCYTKKGSAKTPP